MRFNLLTQYYPPEIGAPQARLSELVQRIAQRGHQVTVLTAMPNYPTGKIYNGYGGLVRHQQMEQSHVIRTFIYPTQKAAVAPRLLNYFSFVGSSVLIGTCALPPADFLMVESPPLFLGLAGIWLSKIHHSRMIFNVSDLWPESAVQLGVVRPHGFGYRLAIYIETLCYHHAWLITGQSKSILANIEYRFSHRPTFHLSNGVDVAKFGKDRRTAAARTSLGGEDELIVMYAGLHGLAQGLDQILDAAAQIGLESRIQFILIGDGPDKLSLVHSAKSRQLNHVHFRPPCPSSEIPELLASADVAIITLKKYIPGAVPSKIYEAMASQCALILVAEGEAAEIVRNSDTGIVVEPGDIAGLTRALYTMRDNPELRRKFGENGRRAAETYFNRDQISSAFIDVLERNA